jgi:hypothetical protein
VAARQPKGKARFNSADRRHYSETLAGRRSASGRCPSRSAGSA